MSVGERSCTTTDIISFFALPGLERSYLLDQIAFGLTCKIRRSGIFASPSRRWQTAQTSAFCRPAFASPCASAWSRAPANEKAKQAPRATNLGDGDRKNRIEPPGEFMKKDSSRERRSCPLLETAVPTCRRTRSGKPRRRDRRTLAATRPNTAGRRRGGLDSGRCRSSLPRTGSRARRRGHHP